MNTKLFVLILSAALLFGYMPLTNAGTMMSMNIKNNTPSEQTVELYGIGLNEDGSTKWSKCSPFKATIPANSTKSVSSACDGFDFNAKLTTTDSGEQLGNDLGEVECDNHGISSTTCTIIKCEKAGQLKGKVIFDDGECS